MFVIPFTRERLLKCPQDNIYSGASFKGVCAPPKLAQNELLGRGRRSVASWGSRRIIYIYSGVTYKGISPPPIWKRYSGAYSTVILFSGVTYKGISAPPELFLGARPPRNPAPHYRPPSCPQFATNLHPNATHSHPHKGSCNVAILGDVMYASRS